MISTVPAALLVLARLNDSKGVRYRRGWGTYTVKQPAIGDGRGFGFGGKNWLGCGPYGDRDGDGYGQPYGDQEGDGRGFGMERRHGNWTGNGDGAGEEAHAQEQGARP